MSANNEPYDHISKERWDKSEESDLLLRLLSDPKLIPYLDKHLKRSQIDDNFPPKTIGKLLSHPKLKEYEESISDIIYPIHKEMMYYGYDIKPPSIYLDESENDIELYWEDEKYDFSMLLNLNIETKRILISAEFESLQEHLDVGVMKETLIQMLGAWFKSIKQNL